MTTPKLQINARRRELSRIYRYQRSLPHRRRFCRVRHINLEECFVL